MASKPFLDLRRMTWLMKYRPEPGGPWKKVVLCKHEGRVHPEPGRTKVPPEGMRRHAEFAEIEYRATHGLAAPPAARPKPLAEHLAEYVASKARTGAASSDIKRRAVVARFVAFAAGQGVTTLQGTNSAFCRAYLESRMKSLRTATLRVERGYLIGAWTRAVKDELIAANPWRGVPIEGRDAPTSITFWTGEEIGAIAASCKANWQSDLVELMANTGMRVSTALLSRWDWIDREGVVMTIRKQDRVKTGYPHVLSMAAREILRRRKDAAAGSPLVFPPLRPGSKSIAYGTAYDPITDAIGRSGVRPGTCHDFRHSYGRTLGLARVPVAVIQRQLGHASLAMTMKYVAVDEEHVGRFVDGIAIGIREPGHPDRPRT